MKVGLYFGSFNPIHIGHLIIANHMVEYTDMDELWMVVSPHNPHKKKASLLNGYTRLEMVEMATEEIPKIKASDIEFNLSKPSYTADTLAHLKDKYPRIEFCLIMGGDNLDTFHKWKNYEYLLENYSIFVYPRPNSENIQFMDHKNVHIVHNVPSMGISSTFIRKGIKEKKNLKPMLAAKVWDYLIHNNLYL